MTKAQARKLRPLTLGRIVNANGYSFRKITTPTHSFIHFFKDSTYSPWVPGTECGPVQYQKGQIEIYEFSNRDGLEMFKGYAEGETFDRLYAVFFAQLVEGERENRARQYYRNVQRIAQYDRTGS